MRAWLEQGSRIVEYFGFLRQVKSAERLARRLAGEQARLEDRPR